MRITEDQADQGATDVANKAYDVCDRLGITGKAREDAADAVWETMWTAIERVNEEMKRGEEG